MGEAPASLRQEERHVPAPAVSIIMPTFNASKKVHVALDTLLLQRFRDFEVIIIDDSSDDYADLLSVVGLPKYRQLPVTILRSERKIYGSGARNEGFDIARGEYVALLDADDEWDPDKLTVALNQLRELEAGGSGKWIIHSRSEICILGKATKLMPLGPVSEKETVAEYLFGPRGWIQTSTILLRADAAREIRFNPDFRRHLDYDFCIRAAAMGYSFHLIEQPLVQYHVDMEADFHAKGETIEYVRYWLKTMRPYLTQRDLITYRAYELPRRIRLERGLLPAALVFAANFPFTSARNQWAFIKLLHAKWFAGAGQCQ